MVVAPFNGDGEDQVTGAVGDRLQVLEGKQVMNAIQIVSY